MQRNQAGSCGLFSPCADAAQMMRIAERDDAAAVLQRARDPELHRLAADDLAKARAAVEPQQRASIEHGPHVLVRHQAALSIRLDVARQHADAMRVMTGEVGLDQVAGDRFDFCVMATKATHHKANRSAQARYVDRVRVHQSAFTIPVEPSVARS